MEDDAKMISDIRAMHAKVMDLHAEYNALRERYTAQDLLKYAELAQVRKDAEQLRELYTWLAVVMDALDDREKKSA